MDRGFGGTGFAIANNDDLEADSQEPKDGEKHDPNQEGGPEEDIAWGLDERNKELEKRNAELEAAQQRLAANKEKLEADVRAAHQEWQTEANKAARARQELLAEEEKRRQAVLAYNTRIQRLQDQEAEWIARVAAAQGQVPVSTDTGQPHDLNASRYSQQRGQGPGLQSGSGTDQSGRQPQQGGGVPPQRMQKNLENPTSTSIGGTSANPPRFAAPSSVVPRQNAVDGPSGGAQVAASVAVSQVPTRSLQTSTSSVLGNYGLTWGRGGQGASVSRSGQLANSRGRLQQPTSQNLPSIPGSPSVHRQLDPDAQPYLPSPDEYLDGAAANLDGSKPTAE